MQGIGWQLGDGVRTRFWEDRWLPYHEKLSTYATIDVDEQRKEDTVCTFVSDNGEWLWERFVPFLPPNVICAIGRINPIDWSGREDKPRWWGTHEGQFSIKSAYLSLCQPQNSTHKGLWRRIWKIPVPQRYRQFLWLCGKDRLLTNLNRFARGLHRSSECQLCANEKEDLLHVLRDCTIASMCWDLIVPPQLLKRFWEIQDSRTWVEWNLGLGHRAKGIPWKAWFAVVSRHIWINRNAHIFQNKAVSSKQIVAQACAVLTTSEQVQRDEISPRADGIWQPPYVGCIKINVDGATIQQANESACAGIARNHDGMMLDGFLFRIGKGTSLHAELWAVLWSLKRAWDLRWRRVVVETDCREAIELLSNGWTEEHQEGALLAEIQRWLEGEWDAKVDWCPRSANHVADLMAKYALDMAKGIVFITQPPDFILPALHIDASM